MRGVFGERDGMGAVSLFYYQCGLLAEAASFFVLLAGLVQNKKWRSEWRREATRSGKG